MPITFDGNLDSVNPSIEGFGLLGMTYGTVIQVMKITTTNPSYAVTWSVATSTPQTAIEVGMSDVAKMIYGTDAAEDETAGGPVPADGWVMVAWTKTTGTVFPEYSIYKWSAGTWSQFTASGASIADSVRTVQQAIIGNQRSNGAGLIGQLAASGAWKNRYMTPSEIRRMIRGRWAEHNPSHLREWPSGLDIPSRLYRSDLSRAQATEARSGAPARATIGNPPGFVYSIINRRR